MHGVVMLCTLLDVLSGFDDSFFALYYYYYMREYVLVISYCRYTYLLPSRQNFIALFVPVSYTHLTLPTTPYV